MLFKPGLTPDAVLLLVSIPMQFLSFGSMQIGPFIYLFICSLTVSIIGKLIGVEQNSSDKESDLAHPKNPVKFLGVKGVEVNPVFSGY